MQLSDVFAAVQVIAVARQDHYADPVGMAAALRAGGLHAIEFTYSGRNATEAIAAVKEALPDMLVGAGTVMDETMLRRAIGAGADFAVSPILDPPLTAAMSDGLLIPGVLTPSELAQARRCGCRVVKIFPARVGGPGYIGDLRAVFPDVGCVVSGGIAVADCQGYLDAGAVAVCVGSSLLGPAGKPATASEIEGRARGVVAALRVPPRALQLPALARQI